MTDVAAQSIQTDQWCVQGDDKGMSAGVADSLSLPPERFDDAVESRAIRGTGYSVTDGTGLFKAKGESDLLMGNDGDDIGQSARDQEIGDMLDSGHGFLIRGIGEPVAVRRTTCEICDGPLPTPGADPDWLCEYYDGTRPASPTCNCSWCLMYQEYLAGNYQPRGGRPRKQCGSAKCKRIAARIRKQRQRGTYVEPEMPQPELRESRALGVARVRVAETPGDQLPVWNRRRLRNEPNWWLHCQRKRGLMGGVTKTL